MYISLLLNHRIYHNPVLIPKMAETTALGAAYAAGLAVSRSRQHLFLCSY